MNNMIEIVSITEFLLLLEFMNLSRLNNDFDIINQGFARIRPAMANK